VAERLKATVLKTVLPKGNGGSNPSCSGKLLWVRDSNPRGSGGEAPPGRRGDRPLNPDLSGLKGPPEGQSPYGNLRSVSEADLGSKPKAGIPPAPVDDFRSVARASRPRKKKIRAAKRFSRYMSKMLTLPKNDY
jgi:hypothetical protein